VVRVAVMDLRGHGDSATTSTSTATCPAQSDMAALVLELGGQAILVGNSTAADSAAIVAGEHPDLVGGLVLVGPFVREPSASKQVKLAVRVPMARPRAAGAWNSYLPKIYAGRRSRQVRGRP
jgi:pimeloyl-ACP methyl ester carboxylesterase